MKLKNAYSTLTILAALLPNAVFAADDSQQGHGLRGHNEQDRKLPSNGKVNGNDKDNGKGNDKDNGKGNGDVDGGGTPKSEPTGRVIISRKSVKKLKTRGKSDNQIAAMRAKGLTKIKQKKVVFESKGEGDFQVVEVPPGTEKEFIDELLRNDVEGLYEYAEPDEIQEIVLTPDDNGFLLSRQYHHSNMQSYDAWDLSTGLSNVTVAICDTGLQLDHPDLAANRLPGYHATVQKWEDDVLDPGDVTAVHPHGTQCAGCAAAIGNNGLGLAGVGWNFRHRPGRVTDSASGNAASSVLADCARKMCELSDVKVVSVSYSGVEGEARREAATYCKTQGALMVNAAGNDGRDLSTFGEADADDLIVAGATTSSDLKSDFSAYGRFVDVWAPGSSVWTTTTGSTYSAVSGTSFSCPLVAGLIALIWSKNPALTPDEVEAILKLSTDNPYNIQEAHNTQYGRINSFKALEAVASGTSHPTPSPTTAPPTTSPTPSPTAESFPEEPTITADHDGTVPRCTQIGGACSSGTLLNGRGAVGPEPNAASSNTIDTCPDGTSGSYLNDESNEAIEVFAANGGLLRVGRMAKIRATVFAWGNGSSDTADFYVTDGDSNPTWTLIGSKKPPGGGIHVIESDPFELTSTLQTIRVQFRYGGYAGSCVSGAYNDRDDLVFAVKSTPNSTPWPTTAPPNPTTPPPSTPPPSTPPPTTAPPNPTTAPPNPTTPPPSTPPPTVTATGGGNNDGSNLLSIAEAVVEACDESVLARDMAGCQTYCHDHMCCFETREYSCFEDPEKHCLVYAGCETLFGSKW